MTPDSADSRERPDVDLVEQLRENPSDVNSLLGDIYRGDIDRATAWRSRLDQTTNWAVVVVAAILTWAFSSQDNPHYVLLIGMFAVAAFLLVEAHRFREYDIWRSRVRSVQRNLFVGMVTSRPYDENWQDSFVQSLDTPSFTMSFSTAVGHRLRRIYLPLLLILLVAWIVRVTVFQSGESWRQTAAIPGVTAVTIVGIVAVVYGLLIVVAVWSATGTETLELRE